MNRYHAITTIISIVLCCIGYAQGVKFSTSDQPLRPSAILELEDNTRGLLIPRMNSTQRDAIASPANGLIIYNLDDTAFNYYSTKSWRFILTDQGNSISGAWKSTGNSFLKAGSNLIGTTDTVGLSVKTNNVTRFFIDTAGNVGIGTMAPQSKLHIAGYIQVDTISSSPPTNDCNEVTEYGRIKMDPNINSMALWTCTADGWVNMMQPRLTMPMPAGSVAYFDLASCPTGWSDYVAGEGRMIMSQGTLGSDVYNLGDVGGSAFHTLSVTELPSHNHSVNPPSQTGTSNGNHTHTVDPPPTSTNTSGAHTHTTTDRYASDLPGANLGPDVPNELLFTSRTVSTTPEGAHSHTINIGSFTSGSSGTHTHTVNISSFNSSSSGSGSAHENRPPYITLKPCQKD